MTDGGFVLGSYDKQVSARWVSFSSCSWCSSSASLFPLAVDTDSLGGERGPILRSHKTSSGNQTKQQTAGPSNW